MDSLYQAVRHPPGHAILLDHGGRASTLTPGWPATLEFRNPRAVLLFAGRTRYFEGSSELPPPDIDPLEAVRKIIEGRRVEGVGAVRLSTELSAPCCLLAVSYEFLEQTEGVVLQQKTAATPSLLAFFYESVQPGHAVHRHRLSTGISFEDTPPLVFPGLPIPEYMALAANDGYELHENDYAARVDSLRKGIYRGDYYVVNLSQRARFRCAGSAEAAWKRWALDQPMPYRAYISLGFGDLLINSPECFARCRGPWIETFPIKGTRRRTGDMANDQKTAAELLADPKELAEHRMIVDLERNDLGKIAAIGSVEVPVRERIEVLPGLFHLVSAVRARLPEKGLAMFPAVVRALFPGGSVTGAPKRAAIQAIDRTEISARGFYTGALFAIDRDGNFEAAMLIRTAMAMGRGNWITAGSGGGIVADSNPHSEAAEVMLKLEGLQNTLARMEKPERKIS
ncbi:MAG: anthranilate synthase component I family protein [Deltaproteobacteria bacterium]|nr:anthranilate synthase component I family protein [Deltaproteobacteria bacterium]